MRPDKWTFRRQPKADRNPRLRCEPLESRLMLDAATGSQGPLLISELMAVNRTTLADEDGDFSDWIEIHNPISTPVDLSGWCLTDDAGDLTRWRFPDVTLDSGGYLVVFASDKDRSAAGSELHANFKLRSDGEYLALVRPDGITVSHEYAPAFPQQSADVSYGLAPMTTTLVDEGAPVTYRVPTAADAPLGASWTEPGFDHTTWTGGRPPKPVLITEVGTDNPDYAEIQNVSHAVVDTDGWFVVANNADDRATGSPDVNAYVPTLWPLPASMAPGEVLYRRDTDDGSGNYWGQDIFWRGSGNGWVMLVDDRAEVVDLAVWGYSTTEIDALAIDVGGFHLTAEGAWSGVSAVAMGTFRESLQRTGDVDHDSAADWAVTEPPTMGGPNLDLITPFPSGPLTAVGFGFDEAVRTDVGPEMQGINTSLWARIPFHVEDPSLYSSMKLRMKYNDGFAAYLNGHRIAARNEPDPLQWDSTATAARDVDQSLLYELIDVSHSVDRLTAGRNVLAVHGLNVHAADDDFLVLPNLIGGSLQGNRQHFVVPTPGGANSPGFVVINEIHYDPQDNNQAWEFIELHNTTDSSIDLSGWRLGDGVRYTFPVGTSIAGGGYLVVAEDPPTIQARFGVAALGPWRGKLDNDGERVELVGLNGYLEDEVDYRCVFPWPVVARGEGSSMELVHPSLDNDLGGSWRPSGYHTIPPQNTDPTPGLRNGGYAEQAPPQIRQVSHTPARPAAEQPVVVSVKVTDPDGVAAVTLEYQLVDPGDYIRLEDAAYQTDWTAMAMSDDGSGGDVTAGDAVYTAVLPGGMQTHRRLVRYRITAADAAGTTITAPFADDPQPNFAYFVYDGVPQWTGADRPGATAPVTYGSDVMGSLPTYHLLSRQADVLNCQYNSAYNDKVFRFSGTLVVGEEVYDHVHYRIRGSGSTYVAGKNKWKFRFNRGHYFQAYDQYGSPWPEKLRTLNFGSATSPWGPANRGMAGMDEALAYRMFNTVGLAAPYLSPLQFRVIDAAEEAHPTNQYEGDLWGLYLAFENPGGRFLDSHGLPDGNLYRYDWSPELENQGPGLPSSLSFVNSFVSAYNRTNPIRPVSWWRQNVDVEGYYSFRTVAEALNHTDWTEEHNMLLFYNPDTDKWSMLPWDLDLLYEEFDRWGPDGIQSHLPYEQFRKMLGHEELNVEFQARARELQDLLLNRDQGWQMVEEYARYVEPMAAVDRAMWDYHPRAGPWHRGAYYQEVAPTPRYPDYPRRAISPVGFEGMVNWVKEFIATGGFGGDQLQVLHTDDAIPRTPTVAAVGGAAIDGLRFTTSAFSDPQGNHTFAALQWRVGEVTDPAAPAHDPAAPILYEITPVWESGELTTFSDTVTIPGGALEVGHSYRVRVRMKDTSGRWSHWSDPATVIPQPPASPVTDELRITEIMYHPVDPTPAELAVDPHFLDEDFEFIELRNTGPAPIDLIGFEFTDGIQFEFSQDGVNTLNPGEFLVLASDLRAFQARYGTGIDVAGEYRGQLRNRGENLTFKDPYHRLVLNFRYEDSEAWPVRPDGFGSSLEIVDPAGDHADPANWRPSSRYGGTPGGPSQGTLGVVINEVFTHSNPPAVDAVELHNTSGEAIDIGGWYLSDSADRLNKFRIPSPTQIPPGGYAVFDETHFNPTPQSPGQNDFALDGAHGDDVWLVVTDGSGKVTHFADDVRFGASRSTESFGRWPDGSGILYPMQGVTLGGPNSGPRVGPVLISELHYQPDVPDEPDQPAADDLEFIEIYNPTDATVEMTDWRLRGGVEFNFADETTLAPYGTLVVVPFGLDEAEKLAAFRAEYGLDGSVALWGGYSGRLSDNGERVTLQRPDGRPELEPWFVPRLLEDQVRYDDGPPWPADASGGGASLNRTALDAWGHSHVSWEARPPTPGVSQFEPTGPRVVARHVFYNDSAFDGDDPTANVSDDAAVAVDKQALLPGQTATFANYTGYANGINGIMVDIADLPEETPLTANDFQFKVGNDDSPGDWENATDPISVTVRRDEGIDESDRVTILWDDNTIQKQWLQITILANQNNGLSEDDVFYFGNAIGETGNSAIDAKVTANDMLGARDNQRSFLDPAPIDFNFDFDRDARVGAVDMLIARNSQTHFLNALQLITVPGPKAANAAPVKAEQKPAHDAVLRRATQQKASPAELSWLHEFEETATGDRPSSDRYASSSPSPLTS